MKLIGMLFTILLAPLYARADVAQIKCANDPKVYVTLDSDPSGNALEWRDNERLRRLPITTYTRDASTISIEVKAESLGSFGQKFIDGGRLTIDLTHMNSDGRFNAIWASYRSWLRSDGSGNTTYNEPLHPQCAVWPTP